MWRSWLIIAALVGGTVACGSEESGDGTDTGTTATTSGPTGSTTPTGECGSVRLTSYSDVGEMTGCGYQRNHPFLAPFVREQNLTLAIAQPFYGSTFGGDPGEACGQCWLISSPTTSAVVMVTNLCPTDGNPLCSDPGQLHFDLSEEAGAFLTAGSNDMGSARPVACPLTGNIHVEFTDRNEWGYFQVALINHVIPVRKVEAQAAAGGNWVPLERVWGAVWAVSDGMFASNGAGGTLRITSAQGEVVTSSVVIGYDQQPHDALDLGVQFTNQESGEGEACSL